MTGAYSMGEVRNDYIILLVKPEEMSPVGAPKHRWHENIKNRPWRSRV
jgi:hypothetical protein